MDDGLLFEQVSTRERTPEDTARVTFGVHDEGDGLFALYMTPSEPRDLIPGLARLKIDELWNVAPSWGLQAARRIPRSMLGTLRGASDLVDAMEEPVVQAQPMIAHPHEVLPEHGPGQLAYSLSHDGHGVVFSREEHVLTALLGGYLESRIAISSRRSLPEEMLAALVAPIPDEMWIEVRLKDRRGRRILSLATVGVDPWQRIRPVQDIRWILS
jgi:hypothetical protein